jgi:dihydropyrimidinase
MRIWGKKMPEKYDILIHKGLVVTGSGVRKADVGIKGEKVVAVKPNLSEKEATRTINASGKYVMPGVIDVHVHPVYEDDLGGLSHTAAFGGTTTLMHFAYAKPGMKLIDTIKRKVSRSPTSTLEFTEHSLTQPLKSKRFPKLLIWG